MSYGDSGCSAGKTTKTEFPAIHQFAPNQSGTPGCHNHTEQTVIELPSNPRKAALTIAILADAIQIALFPLFAEGALSPLDDLLDIAVAWLQTKLLGWHWAFLPTFIAELAPGLDLVPSWTLAVLYVTREIPKEQSSPEPPTIEGHL